MTASRLLCATALGLCLPLTAHAQDAPGLWDLLNPNTLVQRVVQTGIMALRTQFDIKYGDMSVDLVMGQITLTDIRAWPPLQWDADGDCQISFDRLTLRAAPLDRPDLIRFKMQGQGMQVPGPCLPREPRDALAMAGVENLTIPRLTVDLEYDIAQAEADVHAYAQIDRLAALDVTADLSYLWLEGGPDMEEPSPVVYLRRATATVENLGGFEAVRGMLPPPFINPEQAPLVLEGMVGAALAGMNRDAAPEGAPGDPSALNEAQLAFVQSVITAWPAFLQNPGRLVLETGFAPEDDRFVDFLAYGDDPGLMFTEMQPRVSLAPAPARAILPADMVRLALAQDTAGMAPDDQRRVGVALATGVGAPRNIGLGTGILTRLAEAGDGAAALALSAALEPLAPGDAYRWALIAGGQSQVGAAARLDRLERDLGFAQVLELQAQVLGDVQHPMAALASVRLIRDEAMGRLSGVGRERSYAVAALWALMGAAAGDSESLDILQQLDERARRADAAGRSAWAEAEQRAADLATEAWLGQDLPGQLGGQ